MSAKGFDRSIGNLDQNISMLGAAITAYGLAGAGAFGGLIGQLAVIVQQIKVATNEGNIRAIPHLARKAYALCDQIQDLCRKVGAA